MSIRSFPGIVLILVALVAPLAAAAPVEGDTERLTIDLWLLHAEAGRSTAPVVDLGVPLPVPNVEAGGLVPTYVYDPRPITLFPRTSDAPAPEQDEDASGSAGSEEAPPQPSQQGGGAAPAPSALCAPRPSTGPLDLGILPRTCIPLLVEPAPILQGLPLGVAPDAPLAGGSGGAVETAAVAPAGPAADAAAPGGIAGPLAALAGVAAVAAASSAVPAGSLLWERLRRLGLLALAPLYSRLTKDSILAHEARDALFAALREKPGSAIADLAKAADIPRNTATHHLHMLERQGLVSSMRKGRVRLFFPVGSGAERRSADALAILRHETTAALAREIGREPGVDQGSLCASAKLAPSLAHWHVSRLVEAGLVTQVRDGRRVRYYPGETYHLVMSGAVRGT